VEEKPTADVAGVGELRQRLDENEEDEGRRGGGEANSPRSHSRDPVRAHCTERHRGELEPVEEDRVRCHHVRIGLTLKPARTDRIVPKKKGNRDKGR
jgi:hypothetical protein